MVQLRILPNDELITSPARPFSGLILVIGLGVYWVGEILHNSLMSETTRCSLPSWSRIRPGGDC
jgi:hypothetical protein